MAGFGWTGASSRTIVDTVLQRNSPRVPTQIARQEYDRQEYDGPSDAIRPTPDRETDDSVVTVHCSFPVPGSEKMIGFALEIALIRSRCPSLSVAMG
jgi:multidrug efflux pump subunit AcrA (membrane-fusion protein)